MNPIVKKFTFQLTGLTLALGVLTFGFTHLFKTVRVTPAYGPMLGFLFVFTWIAFYATAKSMQKKVSRFANTYMIVNFLKLVIFSLLLLAYAYLNKTDAAPFMITFFVYYIFYTVLEVSMLKTLNEKK
jgi:F0F1-type ATP synthase assembly protein I